MRIIGFRGFSLIVNVAVAGSRHKVWRYFSDVTVKGTTTERQSRISRATHPRRRRYIFHILHFWSRKDHFDCGTCFGGSLFSRAPDYCMFLKKNYKVWRNWDALCMEEKWNPWFVTRNLSAAPHNFSIQKEQSSMNYELADVILDR